METLGVTLDKRRKVALLAVLICVVMMATGFMWAHKQVTVLVDGKNIPVYTLHNYPADVLSQAGIVVGNTDEYRVSENGKPNSPLRNGAVIEVFRAIPITITYQGKTKQVTAAKPTVGEVVASAGLTQRNIRIIPDPQSRPVEGMNIKVVAVREEMKTTETEAAPSVVRQPDPTMEKGLEEVVSEGETGRKLVSVRVRYEDDVQVAEEFVGEKVTVEPKAQVIRTGTRDTVETSRGMSRFREIYWMEATAYTPWDGPGHGITASGIPARRGVVAVDPRVIPLGTRLYIPGYGPALAADTGGAIVGDRIDLCIEGYGEAMSFGRRTVKVYVLAD